MNYRQKQKAMVKLAQVRLAINHVLRKRAMMKQAQSVQGSNPVTNNYNPNWHDAYGYRTWSGLYHGQPYIRPGSIADRDPGAWLRDTFDWFFGQGRYANPNTGTPRAGDSANPRSVNRAANPNAK